jgi:hypothetical protein
MAEQPEKRVKPEAVRQGYEPLSASVKGVGLFAFFFVLTAVVLHTDLWALLRYYITRPRDFPVTPSVVSPVRPEIAHPVQPMPRHNHLPWEDLVELRQKESATFRQWGWKVDPLTEEAEIPEAVVRRVAGRYPQAPATGPVFPPAMAPVRAGPGEPPARAGVFPPVEPMEEAKGGTRYGEAP